MSSGYIFYGFLFLINTWGAATSFVDGNWLELAVHFIAIALLIWRREGVIKVYGGGE